MPLEFRCQSCQKLLRVPDTAAGKKARCPDCGSIQEVPASAPIPGSAFSNSQPTFAGEFGSGTPAPAPAPPASPFGDMAPTGGQLGSSFAPPPNPYQAPQTIGTATSTREAALAKVQGPATALLVISGIAIALQLMGAGLMVVGVVAGGGRVTIEEVIGQIIGLVIGVGFSAVVALGAWNMRQLKAYPLALAGTVLAMLPCSGCCIISMPLAVWSLVVLLDDSVKSHFRG